FVVVLRGEFLRPVQRQVELAAAIVELTGLARRALVVVQQLSDRMVKRLAQDFGPLDAGLDSYILETRSQRQKFAEGIPPQVVLLDQLVDMLGRRTTRSCLIHSPRSE